jgi:hypothetical protein
MRSSTVAKITAAQIVETYPDGSYLVPVHVALRLILFQGCPEQQMPSVVDSLLSR